jgi:hypothetical protein
VAETSWLRAIEVALPTPLDGEGGPERHGKKVCLPMTRVDGTNWFTDPDYGLPGRRNETPGSYVYRCESATRC